MMDATKASKSTGYGNSLNWKDHLWEQLKEKKEHAKVAADVQSQIDEHTNAQAKAGMELALRVGKQKGSAAEKMVLYEELRLATQAKKTLYPYASNASSSKSKRVFVSGNSNSKKEEPGTADPKPVRSVGSFVRSAPSSVGTPSWEESSISDDEDIPKPRSLNSHIKSQAEHVLADVQASIFNNVTAQVTAQVGAVTDSNAHLNTAVTELSATMISQGTEPPTSQSPTHL
jgi:hypothetical protein